MNRIKYLKGECSHCRGHLEFPADSAGTSIDCPHCGQETELLLLAPPEESSIPKRTLTWTVAGAFVLLLASVGLFAAFKRAQRLVARQQKVPEAAATPNSSTRDLSRASRSGTVGLTNLLGFGVSTVKIEKTPGSSLLYAVGTVSNPSARQRFGVRVELDVLDEAGQKIGSATDYQAVMEAQAQWSFKALVVNPKARSARVAAMKEQQ